MNTNVMFTDIVGYSKLTGDDQNLALELLKEHDKVIEPIIKRYNGAIVKRIGDAIVAIFEDASDTIQSSIEIQQSLKNRNNRSIESRHIILRIGLHYGEIIIKNNEVHGLGYEIASSIEPICEYGLIAVSHDLYKQVHENEELILKGKKNHFFIRPIAKFSFKSFSKKISIYKLYLNLLDWYDEDQTKVHTYLDRQNVSSDSYELYQSTMKTSPDVDHYQLGVNLEKKHDLSSAIYHYKMHFDYYLTSKNKKNDTQLMMLNIFAYVGLVRLVDRALQSINSKIIKDSAQLQFINALNLFNKKNFKSAQDRFEQAISTNTSSIFFESCYYLLIIFYQNNEFQKGLDLISYHYKHFQSNSLHALLIQLIKKIFSHELNSKSNVKNNVMELVININKATDFIKNTKDKKFILFAYWFLIQFYKSIHDINKAIEIQDNAEIQINQLSDSISGFQLKSIFSENPLLHQMLTEEIDFQFVDDEGLDDFSEPEQVKMQTIDVFNFCIECGFKNDNKFQFCPSCGTKLTK